MLKCPHPVFYFFILTRCFAVAFSLPCITDVPLYQHYAFTGMGLGLNVYKDFSFEYPPLAISLIYLADTISLSALDLKGYFLAFALLMFVVDYFCLLCCQKFCRENLAMSEHQINYATLLYAIFGLLLYRLLYHRLDIVVALFLTLSLILFDTKTSKIKYGFFINALAGFFYKIVPAFTMPAAIISKAFIDSSHTKQIVKKIFFNSIFFLLCLAAIIYGFEIYTNHHFIKNMLFHEERGIEVESIYGAILLVKYLILGNSPPLYSTYGSADIHSGFYLGIIAKYLGTLLLISFYLALFFTLLHKKNRGRKIVISEENFLDITLITILLTLSFQRVVSPQFFIWLIPIAAIWNAKKRSFVGSIAFLSAFSFLFFATFFIFSDHAIPIETPIIILMLSTKNLILLILTYLITTNFLRNLRNSNE